MNKNQSEGTEDLLLEQARAGNAEAFSELVRLHSSKLYGISLKILKNREDAEDNLQNVLCKAFRKIREFQGHSRVSTWLFRIAINEALMKLRQSRSEHVINYSDLAGAREDESDLLEMEDFRPDPERQCTAADLAAKAFQGIDPALVSTFILSKAEGWTNRELAKALGTTAGNVKSRIFRTRTKLRQHMLALSQDPAIQMHA
jgi:RNA polymerase sigma-70 factor, ECF subfamily